MHSKNVHTVSSFVYSEEDEVPSKKTAVNKKSAKAAQNESDDDEDEEEGNCLISDDFYDILCSQKNHLWFA